MSMISEVDIMKVRHDSEVNHILDQLEFYMKRCNELEASKEKTTSAANELLGKIRELTNENKELRSENETLVKRYDERNDYIGSLVAEKIDVESALEKVITSYEQLITYKDEQLEALRTENEALKQTLISVANYFAIYNDVVEFIEDVFSKLASED